MLKKVLIGSISALLLMQCGQGEASLSRLLNPPAEQAEDFSYYQQYNWDSPVERKALYEAIANGQLHMYTKMRTCMSETYDHLEDWLDAFKGGREKVEYREDGQGLRDMDGREIRDPENGDLVGRWLTRDYAENHVQGYTGLNLRQLQNKYWGHCLAELPVQLFTKEAQQRLDAKAEREPVYR